MDISKIALFDLADQRLAWVDRRQGLLAQNVANADTPGWQPRELSPFAASLAGTGLAQTDARHLSGTGRGGSRPLRPLNAAHSPDGNGVALDTQLARVAETETIHDLVGDLYKKYLGFFKIAIGR